MSEKSLDELITTLKSEAIEAADKEANQILENAQNQAQRIITEAEAKKVELLKQAQKEAQATLNKGDAALKQAARDLKVSVRNDLLRLLKVVLQQEVESSFTPELIENAVLKVIENVGSGSALQLAESMETKLAENICKRLQSNSNISEITKDSNLLIGFVVTKTKEGWSYEITPEEVTELLNKHLGPRWALMLKNTSEG
ncbi:hypothetical protein [Flagellimonas meridianipacifica]|uniref:V/A-type H+-transporting ATPase subunit E n=1 Tax=Flagellimonas meridianipacifica TaxID=1080225 RepID=A0A2T0MD46_9FLAO|nr:hypothetical protein [Allomuricauda pacifica]PRX55415.1 hypothetical protein CLV81_3827 [Allomuricauda pacifica]